MREEAAPPHVTTLSLMAMQALYRPAFSLRAALPLLFLLPACAGSGAAEDEDSVAWLVRHGRFDEAVERAASERERRPEDAQAIEDHRMASTAWLLERGRRLYFAGRYEEALEVFHQARQTAPEHEVVQGWIDTTLDRLADQCLERGLEQHNRDDVEGAIASYERALSYRPQHALVRESLARALLQQNFRQGMGKEYYDDGVRALDRYFLHEARSLFSYVLKYEPKNERASQRGDQTQELLAVERATVAAELEDKREFSAARNEYRLALLLDPDLEQARRGLENMTREERVAELLRESERLFLKQRFDEATQRLDEAQRSTDRQGPEIEARRAELHQAQLEGLYQDARTLESDWRYEEAVAAYARLLEREPFFRDAIARKDTLESYVIQAEELYQRYEAAADDEQRLGLLRQIAVFWPEYRDVRRRLTELEGPQPDGR